MNILKKTGLGLVSLAVSVSVFPSTVSAQGAQIEEIVVEARRRTESLQDVPISITALNEDALRDLGVDEIKDLSSFTPGLNIEGGVDNNTSRFFIRGVGTATPTFGNEQAVPLYIDDIYTPLGIGSNIDMLSVDRVEVLSGPQGTLYGRNSLGGAVKIYSKQFSGESEGNVALTFGSFGQRNILGEYQAPIIQDKLFFGAAFASIQNDGIQDNVYTNTKGWEDDKSLYRIRVEGRPNDQLTLRYSYEENDSAGAAKQLRRRPGTGPNGSIDWEGFLQLNIDAYNTAIVNLHALGIDGYGAADYPVLPDATPDYANNIDSPYAGDVDNIFSDLIGDNVVQTEGHTLTIDYAVNDNINLKYLGSQFEIFNTRLFDIDGSVEAYFSGSEEFEYESGSHEFRIEYGGDRWDLAAGVYLYEEDHTALQAFHNLFPAPFSQHGTVTALIQDVVDQAVIDIGAGQAPDLSGIPDTPAAVVVDPLGQISGTNYLELRQNLRQNTESTAFYANLGFQATEQLRLSLGVRRTEDDKVGETPVGNSDGGPVITIPASISPGTGNLFPVGGLGQFFTENGISQFAQDNYITVNGDAPRINPPTDPFGNLGTIEETFSETTIEFTADYSVDEDSLLYGSYKQGFQSGIIVPIDIIDSFTTAGGQTVSLDNSPVTSPQRIDAFELGYKTVINDRIRWNSAAYYYDWSDLILFQNFVVGAGTQTFGTLGAPTNSATATSFGLETDIQWLVSENLSLFANVGFNKFSLDSAFATNLETGEQIDTTDQFVDDYPAATPERKVTVGGEYIQLLSDGAELRWWATAAWRDDISTNGQSSFQNAGINLLTTAQLAESDHWISDSFTNLSAGVSYTNGDWRVDLRGENLLDERRVEATVNSRPGFFFGTLETYNKPMNGTLTISRSF
jgi:iron complex outermembrane receptor protein